MGSIQNANRIYLITEPRTASNLLVKILNLPDQANLLHNSPGSGYFFIEYTFLSNKLKTLGQHVDDRNPEDDVELSEKLQELYEKFEAYLETAKSENKTVFVKEHAHIFADDAAISGFMYQDRKVAHKPIRVKVPSTYGTEMTWSENNLTVFPDQFLRTWKPTFLIRHPAMSFPSSYRAFTDLKVMQEADNFRMTMTLHWQRSLYEFYCKELPKHRSSGSEDDSSPIIIDADDVIESPAVARAYAKRIGLDPELLKFSWMPAPEGSSAASAGLAHPGSIRMLSTLSASTGIEKGKSASNIDIEEEAKKWKEEFGEEYGGKIEGWVREAMPDYEYLTARRLKREVA